MKGSPGPILPANQQELCNGTYTMDRQKDCARCCIFRDRLRGFSEDGDTYADVEFGAE